VLELAVTRFAGGLGVSVSFDEPHAISIDTSPIVIDKIITFFISFSQ
jgi:hypothetical protein